MSDRRHGAVASFNYRADRALSGRRRRSERGDGRRFERRAKRIVVAQRLEIGIVPGQRAVFRVEGDGALEMGDGFGMLVALRVGDGQHVEGVVVVGILVAHQAQVRDRLIVLPAVDGERRGIEPFVDGLRRGFAAASPGARRCSGTAARARAALFPRDTAGGPIRAASAPADSHAAAALRGPVRRARPPRNRSIAAAALAACAGRLARMRGGLPGARRRVGCRTGTRGGAWRCGFRRTGLPAAASP